MSNIAVLQPERLRRQYQLDTFVETGCNLGVSLALARLSGYAKLISCDVDPRCVPACRKNFPKAGILLADSLTMLGPCLPALGKVMGRTLFWLDAHFPSFYGLPEPPAQRYPLPQELRLIRQGKTGWQHDVIGMDDLRIIRDPRNPRYQPGEPGVDPALYQDVTIAGLYEPFAATHTLQLIAAEEGAMVFLPRAA
ncbi:MAG: hypothetical protein ACRD1C_06550 [Terriglobales bacterium]